MTAKRVLLRPQGLRPRARAPLVPLLCYFPVSLSSVNGSISKMGPPPPRQLRHWLGPKKGSWGRLEVSKEIVLIKNDRNWQFGTSAPVSHRINVVVRYRYLFFWSGGSKWLDNFLCGPILYVHPRFSKKMSF